MLTVNNGINFPLSLQLINGDSTFLSTATVKATIYESDGTNIAVEEKTLTYDSILKTYFYEIDITSDWSDMSIGNYLVVYSVSNAVAFPDTQVENLTIVAGGDIDGLSLDAALNIILAACAGKSSGGGTTDIRFRDQADTKDRIIATVDKRGNRTNISVDGS